MGTDISLDHEDVEGAFANGRNFANKIWNAGRFVLLSLGDAPVRPLAEVESDLALEDRWMLSRVRSAAENATRGLERYRLHDVAESLYHFFWGEVCDWYLEFVKARLTENADAASREAARSTLVTVLDHSYRLLHPIVPFVTAELWSRLPWPEGDERPEDLIVAPWPDGSDGRRDEQAEQDFEALKELVVEVRRLRKEYGVPEAERIQIRLTGGDSGLLGTVRSQSAALERLARIGGIHEGEGSGIGAHAVLSGGTELFVPLEGVIDLDRERSRLRGEIERLQGLSAGASKKLDNENFVSRAPDEVVQKERDKLAQYDEQASKLQEKLAELEGGAS
jgi:valyl-tRNA synthetase